MHCGALPIGAILGGDYPYEGLAPLDRGSSDIFDEMHGLAFLVRPRDVLRKVLDDRPVVEMFLYGRHIKKPLSQWIHVFGDGATAPVQRDLYSAFLATCCDANTLDICQVEQTWRAAEPLRSSSPPCAIGRS
jgi:hypothetical protein